MGEETDEPVDGFSHLTASDWKRVAAFENQIIAHHSNFDFKVPGRLRRGISMNPCDPFLTFIPMALIEPNLPRWRAHAEQNNRRGLSDLNMAMTYRFMLLKMLAA
jgi:hypothetical protein